MRIYWHSTAPWSPSSYSVLTARTVPHVVQAGHEVTIGTWYGLSGQPMPWSIVGENGKDPKTVTILPHHQVGGNVYGEAVLVENYRWAQADVCMTVCDVFVFPPNVTRRVNFAPWFPMDIAPAPKTILSCLETAMYPMVYSRWGVDVLARAGMKAHYVPASAPSDVFTPMDKALARERFAVGREYEFLATMVAANKDGSDRKGFAEALLGFARFAESHEDAILYVHTDWGGPIKVAEMARGLGIEKQVIQAPQYEYIMGMLDEAYMADVYRASDVLLNPAKSEGFGLPLVEAQMCGCPVAATAFSTTDELLFAGWKLDGQLDWYAGPDSWRMRVYVDSIVDALEEAYRERDNEALREQARKGAVRFDGLAVFEQHWRPALRDIERLVVGAREEVKRGSVKRGREAGSVKRGREAGT